MTKKILVKRKNLIIAFSIIILAALGSYFYYLRALPKKEISPQSQPQIAPAIRPVVDIFFTTAVDFAPYGDFNFKYPSNLILKKDALESNLLGKKYHFVMLEDASPAGESPAQIEINKPGASCADYKHCSEIKGIVLGTNSEDEKFIERFEEVVRNFQVR